MALIKEEHEYKTVIVDSVTALERLFSILSRTKRAIIRLVSRWRDHTHDREKHERRVRADTDSRTSHQDPHAYNARVAPTLEIRGGSP